MAITVAEETTVQRQAIEARALQGFWDHAYNAMIWRQQERDMSKHSARRPRKLVIKDTVDYRIVGNSSTGQVFRANILKARFTLKEYNAGRWAGVTAEKVPSELLIAGHGGTIVVDMNTGRGKSTAGEVELLQPLTPAEIIADAAERRSPKAIEAMTNAELGHAIRAHLNADKIAEIIADTTPSL